MELLLIIVGGALMTAIIFMIVDRIRGNLPDDEEIIIPGDFHERFPDRKRGE